MAATTTTASSLQGVPQILARETEAEKSVNAAMATCRETETSLAGAQREELQKSVAAAQAKAEAEVAAFEKDELAKIEEQGKADADAQMNMIDANYKKHSVAVTGTLLTTLKNPAFLS